MLLDEIRFRVVAGNKAKNTRTRFYTLDEAELDKNIFMLRQYHWD